MPAIYWIDNDAGYERWVSAHPNGFIANLYNPPAGEYFKIHSAKHNLPDRSKPGSINPRTGNRYSKVTAEGISELIAWAKENLPSLKEIGNTNYCKICTPTDDSPTIGFGEADLREARIETRGRVQRPAGVLKSTAAQGTTKVFDNEIIHPSANSPFLYSGEEINIILGAYRRLFPNPKNPELRKHLDLDRRRPWSLLTTDFHQVNSSIIEKYHIEREKVQLEGLPYQEAGRVLQKLCTKYPNISGSLGISPWTDTILLETFHTNIEQIWAIIGHDWYPIIPRLALKDKLIIRPGRSLLIESRSPKRRYPIYTKNPYYPRWEDYKSSLPTPPSNTCLLFLNLVPDLRPPAVKSQHTFPFAGSGLSGYSECVEGTVNLLKALATDIELSRILCWGGKVRDAISRILRIKPYLLKDPIPTPLRIGKYNPKVIASYHPGAADKYFSEDRKKYYDHCWLILQSNG